MLDHCCGLHCVVGPHILDHIAANARKKRLREAAIRTRALTFTMRLARALGTTRLLPALGQDDDLRHRSPLFRTIRNARHREADAGPVMRNEGQGPCGDQAADEAYDGLGHTFQFYLDNFKRNGIDGKNGSMLAVVHYGKLYDNAFYDGDSMQFGDGDGELFNRFTIALDVIGHELTHGVTGTTAGLDYQGQPGALNESVSDRMGAAIRQAALGLAVGNDGGWLIGKGLLADGVHGRALRDMKAPGTAYDDPNLGKDPQPADMAHFVKTRQDNGGVHINSGIPNRAFYLLAQGLGDTLKAAAVTYECLKSDAVPQSCDFATWAKAELTEAERLFGADGRAAVQDAWQSVGVLTARGEAVAA